MSKDELKERIKAYNFQQHEKALAQYHRQYDDLLYFNATLDATGKETNLTWRNLLIDDALAMCGSPYHRISRQRWSEDGYRFLVQFTGG